MRTGLRSRGRRAELLLAACLAALAATCVGVALAAGPTYDTTFDDDGGQVTDIQSSVLGSHDVANDLAIQDDDKVVLAGDAITDPADPFDSSDAAVVRYEEDGDLDSTFSGDGKVLFGVADNYEAANAVALDADGNIVVAGGVKLNVSGSDRFHFAALRLDPEGDPDSGFGTAGLATVDVNAGQPITANDVAMAMAIQSDGKILLAGDGDPDPAPMVSTQTMTVVRLETDGDPDPTFGTGGIKKVIFPGGGLSNGAGIDIDSTGKIVVAGFYVGSGAETEFAVARLETDGDLDPTFSTDGMVTSPSFDSFPSALAVDGSDRPVVMGYSNAGESVIARYTTAGVLDAGFGGDGIATTPFSAFANIGPFQAEDIAIESDGNLTVAGGSVDVMRAIRFAPDGEIISSIDGVSAEPGQPNAGQGATSVGFDSAGRVVLGGYLFPDGEQLANFAAVRLTSLGTPRPTTQINRVAVNSRERKAQVFFSGSASDPPLSFVCKLDRKPESSCASPKTYRRLTPGRHTVRVTAVDGAGDKDLTPARKSFRIRK